MELIPQLARDIPVRGLLANGNGNQEFGIGKFRSGFQLFLKPEDHFL